MWNRIVTDLKQSDYQTPHHSPSGIAPLRRIGIDFPKQLDRLHLERRQERQTQHVPQTAEDHSGLEQSLKWHRFPHELVHSWCKPQYWKCHLGGARIESRAIDPLCFVAKQIESFLYKVGITVLSPLVWWPLRTATSLLCSRLTHLLDHGRAQNSHHRYRDCSDHQTE